MAPNPDPKEPIGLSLLTRAHSPTTAHTIYTEKVRLRPLHLKPTTTPSLPSTQQSRRLARQTKSSRKKHRKPPPLSSRQKRALCLYDIPKNSAKYNIYEPLHRMWISYIQEILGTGEIKGAGAAKLVSADYHGAELEVVRSRCVGRVGVRGIVVRDLRGVFEVVTREDKVKVVPKEGTVFRFVVPRKMETEEQVGDEEKEEEKGKEKTLIFELHGDQFQYRAADRANKKFKAHFLPDL